MTTFVLREGRDDFFSFSPFWVVGVVRFLFHFIDVVGGGLFIKLKSALGILFSTPLSPGEKPGGERGDGNG